MRKIDKAPPTVTGNVGADLIALREYLVYLTEQINWILTLITKVRTEVRDAKL